MSGEDTYPKALRIDAEDAEGGWWGTVWPVGALYFSVADGNPGATLGFGMWALFTKGRLLMAPPAPATDVFIWVRLS